MLLSVKGIVLYYFDCFVQFWLLSARMDTSMARILRPNPVFLPYSHFIWFMSLIRSKSSAIYSTRDFPSLLFSHIQRLHVPNTLRILLDTPVTRKEAHPCHTRNTFPNPPILILKRLINQIVRLTVRPEVIRHQIVIAMLDDGVDKG
jgi:hypothetical protein